MKRKSMLAFPFVVFTIIVLMLTFYMSLKIIKLKVSIENKIPFFNKDIGVRYDFATYTVDAVLLDTSCSSLIYNDSYSFIYHLLTDTSNEKVTKLKECMKGKLNGYNDKEGVYKILVFRIITFPYKELFSYNTEGEYYGEDEYNIMIYTPHEKLLEVKIEYGK